MAVSAQNQQSNTSLSYSQFIPKWSKGDSWSLECSGLSLIEDISTRHYYGRVTMTVIQTPADGNGCYVISVDANDRLRRIYSTWGHISDKRVFITLDPNDLSLLETKTVRYTDANDVVIEEYSGHKIQRILMISGVQLMLPVLSQVNDKNVHYNVAGGFGTKAGITNFEGKEALVLYCSYGLEKTEEDILKRIDKGPHFARLLWKKGDVWWTRQSGLRRSRYRLELIRSESQVTDANSVEAKFATLYSRYKTAKAQGNTIESDEICYDIVKLGNQAVPSIMDKIKLGDESLIPVLSEITGFVPRNATVDKSLDWWERNKSTWNEYVERTKRQN